MKQTLLTIVFMLTAITGWAYEEMETHPKVHSIDGVWYQNIDGEAWVSSRWHFGYEMIVLQDWNCYSGDVVIPETVDWWEGDNPNTPEIEEGSVKMTLPVVGIMESAFNGSEGLMSVSIPHSVKTIEGGAFSGCTQLTEITFPNSVESIGSSVCEYCSGLRKVVIEDGPTVLQWNGLCENWDYLETIDEFYVGRPYTTPENCNAFRALPIKKITFGDYVEQIYTEDVAYSEKLETVVLGEGIRRIGARAFTGTPTLQTVTFSEGVEVIDDDAFNSCGFSSITLPSTLLRLGNCVFLNCDKLTEITFPSNVESIGAGICEYCSGLRKVVIEDGPTVLQWNGLCENWDYLGTIDEFYVGRPYTTPENCNAFRSLPIKKITFGDYVEQIYPEDVAYSQKLETVVLGEGIRRIGARAFTGTPTLQTVTFSEGVEVIDDDAFNSCGFSSITLPSTLLRLGNCVFLNCDKLTEITFPSNVESIGAGICEYCSGLRKVVIEDGPTVLQWNGLCENWDYLGTIDEFYVGRPYTTPENANAFRALPIRKITFGDYVEYIYAEDVAYCGEKLETVVLGKGIKSINGSAFAGDNMVKDLYVIATEPPVVDGETLGDVPPQTCKLYVPASSLEAYKAAPVWKDFFNIEGTDSSVKAITTNPSSPYNIRYYDLQGRNVTNPQASGIYIHNGKKVIIK